MRTSLSIFATAFALVISAGMAVAEDDVPVRTFTPQLPLTASAQPMEVTPAASSDDEFPTGAITDTQSLALPMAKDDDEQ